MTNAEQRTTSAPIFPQEKYMKLGQDDLVAVALDAVVRSGETPTFERLVAKCFELFPKRFCLHGYPQWPNAVVVNKAWLRCRSDKKLLTGSVAEGFRLTPKGEELVRKILGLLTGEGGQYVPSRISKKKIDRQTMEGRVATRVEGSQAYKKYLQAKSLEGITEYELCDLLYATTESTPETLAKNFEAVIQQLVSYGRKDLVDFIQSLRQRFIRRFVSTSHRGGMLPQK